jgi:hypothetical protein
MCPEVVCRVTWPSNHDDITQTDILELMQAKGPRPTSSGPRATATSAAQNRGGASSRPSNSPSPAAMVCGTTT